MDPVKWVFNQHPEWNGFRSYGDSVDIRIGMDLRHGGDLTDIQYGMDRPEPVDYGISGRHGSGGQALANP
jgi:hypothetical protein